MSKTKIPQESILTQDNLTKNPGVDKFLHFCDSGE